MKTWWDDIKDLVYPGGYSVSREMEKKNYGASTKPRFTWKTVVKLICVCIHYYY